MPKFDVTITVHTTVADEDMEGACVEADALACDIQQMVSGLHAEVSDVVSDVPDEDFYEMEAT